MPTNTTTGLHSTPGNEKKLKKKTYAGKPNANEFHAVRPRHVVMVVRSRTGLGEREEEGNEMVCHF